MEVQIQVYDSLQEFWNAYSRHDQTPHGYDAWTIVRFLHISDAQYAEQQAMGKDELGFQPLSLTLANPSAKQSKSILIKNIDDKLFKDLRDYHSERFMSQLDKRFGSFSPETFNAFAEYEDWESFHNSWLERDGKPVLSHNVPLLFDHMPRIEYWHRKQTGQKVLPYQRLLVTTFFVSKNQFFDFFIKDVSDTDMEHIKLLMKSRIGLNIEALFSPFNAEVSTSHGA